VTATTEPADAEIPPEIPDAPDDPDAVSAHDIIARNELDLVGTTDAADGRRYRDLNRGHARYVEDLQRWVLFNGTHMELDTKENLGALALTAAVTRWIREVEAPDAPDEPSPDGGDSPRRRLLKHAVATEALPARRRMLASATAWPDMRVREDQLDRVGSDLVVRNGVVDLNTGDLRAGRTTDLNVRSCAVDYEPGITSKLLDQFFETFLPDPLDQRFVFAVLGQALRAGNETRTFPIIMGGTTSGKSQLIAAVHAVLGSYCCTVGSSIFRGNLDDKPRPDLVKAMYTRLAYASEASKSWALHADQIKRLTGGDSLPYRDLYGNMENVTPRFTPLLVTNTLPRITNADPALRRRILVINFDHSIAAADEDTEIKKRFIADVNCRRALLARLVAGARDSLAELKNIPTRYVLATLAAQSELDHVDEFLTWLRDEGTLVDVDWDTPLSHCVKHSQLHEWYVLWIVKHGDKIDRQDALNMRGLGEALRLRGWSSKLSAGTRWLGRRLVSPLSTVT